MAEETFKKGELSSALDILLLNSVGMPPFDTDSVYQIIEKNEGAVLWNHATAMGKRVQILDIFDNKRQLVQVKDKEGNITTVSWKDLRQNPADKEMKLLQAYFNDKGADDIHKMIEAVLQ